MIIELFGWECVIFFKIKGRRTPKVIQKSLGLPPQFKKRGLCLGFNKSNDHHQKPWESDSLPSRAMGAWPLPPRFWRMEHYGGMAEDFNNKCQATYRKMLCGATEVGLPWDLKQVKPPAYNSAQSSMGLQLMRVDARTVPSQNLVVRMTQCVQKTRPLPLWKEQEKWSFMV